VPGELDAHLWGKIEGQHFAYPSISKCAYDD